MPLFNFKCDSCGKTLKKILTPAEVKTFTSQCDCGTGKFERLPIAPSTSVKETLDNGVMARPVERYSNAVELYKDHAKNDPRNKRE